MDRVARPLRAGVAILAILLGTGGGFVLWFPLAMLFLALPPGPATGWLLAWSAVFGWRHLRPGSRTCYVGEGSAGAGWSWLAGTTAVLLVFDFAFLVLYRSVLPVPPPPHTVLYDYALRPGGALPYVLVVALVAPLVEEVTFRGWLQGRLARVTGPTFAISASAALFAALHLIPVLFLYYLVWGIILGYAVHATRSLWTGIVLHGLPNLVTALERLDLIPDIPLDPSEYSPAGLAAWALVFVVSGVALVNLLRDGRALAPAVA